jgi:cell division protein FtsL
MRGMNLRTPTNPIPENKKQRIVRAVVVKNRRTSPTTEAASNPEEISDPRIAPARLPVKQNMARWFGVFSLFFAMLPLVVGFCYLISARHQVLRTGITLAKLSRDQDKLLQENRELSVEKATLRSPIKIAEIATKELKMSIPEPKRVVILDQEEEEIPPLQPAPTSQESFGGHLAQ